MPEDAPGNPGAARSAVPPARQAAVYRTVREMQAKLHRWAGEDSSRRFGDLFNLVYDPDFLAEAWFRVKANAGSRTPGIDGATVAGIENRIGVGAFLEQIRGLLKSGEFRPQPVRQVMIPKKSGKLRKLGIATVADRVVQAALKLVLEPIVEADFQPCSYGFRPNRRAHDAIAEIRYWASAPRNYRWVLEADIRACLDACSHCSSANCLYQNRPSRGAGISIRRPFLLPVRVRTALRSPRLTFCKTACRETPSARLAW
jgi:RNA-directed DNA polymerase